MNTYRKLIFKLVALIMMMSLLPELNAQVMNPVKWSFSIKRISNSDSELVLSATIDKGWHLYSQDIPEGGPVATIFTFDKGTGFFLIGKVMEPKAIEVFDKQFKMKVKYFTEKVEFRQKVKIMSDKQVVLKGSLEFMCCNDENCLPPTEVSFEFKLPPSK